MSSEKILIEQQINKLGLKAYPEIIAKSTELLRLLSLKQSNSLNTIGDYGKAIICIDLATTLLGISIDYDDVIKYSGLRKTSYLNHKRIFEKLLDLNKPIGINEICVQMDLNETKNKAIQLLEYYKESMEISSNEIDLSHPQYAAMAVYQACKIMKKKFSKTKLITFSHLKLPQWNRLEQQWNKIAENNKKLHHLEKPVEEIESKQGEEKLNEHININSKKLKVPEVEDYEIWKERILAFANLQYSMENQNLNDSDNSIF